MVFVISLSYGEVKIDKIFEFKDNLIYIGSFRFVKVIYNEMLFLINK